jgi:hypothetical protein
VSCNKALLEVIENVPEYESYRLRAVAPGQDHAAIHQRPLPVSHAHSHHAGHELVLLAVMGSCRGRWLWRSAPVVGYSNV